MLSVPNGIPRRKVVKVLMRINGDPPVGRDWLIPHAYIADIEDGIELKVVEITLDRRSRSLLRIEANAAWFAGPS